MGRVNVFYRIIMTASFFISANSFLLLRDNLRLIPAAIFLFLIPNIFCGLGGKDVRGARLKICSHGAWCLVIFAVSAVLSAVLQIIMLFYTLPNLKLTLLNLLFCFAAHFLLFLERYYQCLLYVCAARYPPACCRRAVRTDSDSQSFCAEKYYKGHA